MQESKYTNYINRGVRAAGVYAWKICDRFTANIADCWYSGPKGDLWVEFKYCKAITKKKTVSPRFTKNQIEWLNARSAEGRNVAAIVGTPEGGVVLTNGEWNNNRVELTDPKPYSALVNWILGEVS